MKKRIHNLRPYPEGEESQGGEIEPEGKRALAIDAGKGSTKRKGDEGDVLEGCGGEGY